MALKLYNTLSRKKELFKPLKSGFVGLYTCGPTVYNFAHIGNLRTYIFEDILKRVLMLNGYKVKHIMNITDIEDKIIREARQAGVGIQEFVKPYEGAVYEDLAKLNILKASRYPKATEHVREMVKLIQILLTKRLAYQSDGSVYYDISAFPRYGCLSRLKKRELKAGVRMDADEYAKNDVQDFVLWKGKKAGEPSWPAPFGEGRPGWHIECSAMAMKYLGVTFDIHAGGVDLIFPHHENEIAQSEGATGKLFARFFTEGAHLMVQGAKMSKSLGNTYTLRDIEAKKYSPLAFRYLMLTAHYRSTLNFTWRSLASAATALDELITFTADVAGEAKKTRGSGTASFKKYKDAFLDAVHDDLNVPKALGIVWKFIRDYRKLKTPDPKNALASMLWFDHVLGLNLKNAAGAAPTIPADIKKLAQKREMARKAKNWRAADDIRRKLAQVGWAIEDTPLGPKIRPTSRL